MRFKNRLSKNIKDVLENTFNEIKELRELITPKLTLQEVGTITTVSTGIANVSGLHSADFEEVVKFPNDVFGIAFNVDEEEIGTVRLVLAILPSTKVTFIRISEKNRFSS